MIKIAKQTIFILILGLFPNFSFGQYFYYQDNGTSLVNFNGKNDFKIALQIAGDPKLKERSIQLGYGFLEKLNFSMAMLKHNYELPLQNAQGSILTDGVTYSSSLGISHFLKKSNSENIFSRLNNEIGILLFGNIGYTYGSIDNQIDTRFFSTLNYHKAFAQFGMAYKAKSFNLNVSVKYAKIKYLKVNAVAGASQYDFFIKAFLENLEKNANNYSSLDINFQGEAGIRQIKLITGINLNIGKLPIFNTGQSIYLGLIVEIDDIIKYGLFKKE